MSKATSTASAAPGERLSLGSKPLHSLPNLAASLPSDADAASSSSSAALITPDLLSLATPTPSYVDVQAWNLLTTEMVYSLVQSARFSAKKHENARKQLQRAGLQVASAPAQSVTSPIPTGTALGDTPTGSHSRIAESTELEAMVSARLESIGFHVGASLAENLSRERAKLPETLDVLKFICKELWTTIWGKQVDNLRTNHRGVYVLQDNAFKPLSRVSTSRGAQETTKEIKLFLAYPVGIVRGALAQLEVPSVVMAETSQAPQCTFHVKTQRSANPPPA